MRSVQAQPALDWVVRTCAVLGAVAGAWACYGFGVQVSGVLLGAVAAVNGGLFGALVAGTLADRLAGRIRRFGQARRTDGPQSP